MFTHIHISWSPSAARSHFKVLMLYLEYQYVPTWTKTLCLNKSKGYFTITTTTICSCHDYLCQTNSRVWSSILPQLHQTNQTLPVSLASPDHGQNYDYDDNKDGHDYVEDCDEGHCDCDDDNVKLMTMLMKNLRDAGVTKTMTMMMIWWFRWRWWFWWRTCGTPGWPPRPPAQGQDGLPDQGGDQEIAICCTPVIPRCQQSQRTVGNNKELRRSKRGSGNHHYRPPSGMIRKYRISDALHVHYQRPLVHLSNTQALCWEPLQDLLIHASSSQRFSHFILFFHWNCCLMGIYFVLGKLSRSRHSNILTICSVMLVAWLKIVIQFFFSRLQLWE